MISQGSCILLLFLGCFNFQTSESLFFGRRSVGKETITFQLTTELGPVETLKATEVDPCKSPAILTDLSGTLDYPAAGSYSSFKNCRWIIYARNPKSKIRIEFTFMNIENDQPCDDYIQIFSMTHRPDSQGKHQAVDFSGRLCKSNLGQLSKKVYEVDSPAALLIFRSDWIFTARGFSLNYQIIPPPGSTSPPTTRVTTQSTSATTAQTSSQQTATTQTTAAPPTTTSATTTTTQPTTTTTKTTTSTTPSTTTKAAKLLDTTRYSCNFETSGCAWLNSPSTKLDFAIIKARDGRFTNWAKQDHTTGNGQGSYAYLYTNRKNKGDEGALVSPELPANPSTSRCLTFWYTMLQTTSSLIVSLVDQAGNKQEIFNRDAGQGKNWHLAIVSLQSPSPFNVEISHSRGAYSTESGVALDDISISNSPCPSSPEQCGVTSYPSITSKSKSSWELLPGFESPDFSSETQIAKIIGGVDTSIHQWPWVVRIRVYKNGLTGGTFSQCGGTLIDPQWIVTAAHCFESGTVVTTDPANTLISFGEHDVTESAEFEYTLRPEQVILHPERSTSLKSRGIYSKKYDITLLKLKHPVQLDSRVNTACLPTSAFPPGTACYALGWGLDDTDQVNPVLQKLRKTIVSEDDCSYPIIEGMTCAKGSGYSDVCAGDSGGPLVCSRGGKFELAGVVSFGDKCSARRHTTGVYANVHHFVTWIHNTMNSVY